MDPTEGKYKQRWVGLGLCSWNEDVLYTEDNGEVSRWNTHKYWIKGWKWSVGLPSQVDSGQTPPLQTHYILPTANLHSSCIKLFSHQQEEAHASSTRVYW